jgi:hypothetical protein
MKLRKVILLFFIVLFNLGAPSLALAEDNRVILDQLLTGDVPQLNANDIKIPDDLKPGYHELQVEVLDDSGVVSSRTALFCKDLTGELHFDNNCPDLLVTNDNKVFRSAFKPYDPTSDPVGTASIALVAFAVASSLLGFGSNRFDQNPASNQDEDQDSMGDLGSVSAAKLAARENPQAWGDRRWYINTTLFNSLDDLSTSVAKGISGFSVLLARTILDARYLRAVIGNLAWITIPAALTVSFIGLNQIDNQALPFELIPLIILMCIGIFDALAGFFGAFLYLNFIFANGNFTSKEAVFTSLGVALIFFAPGLIASKFRPLTRSVKNFSNLWERGTDYVLASLLTGWSVSKLVEALPGLSKLTLPIVDHAGQIGVIAGLAVACRLLIEEFAWYFYPSRLAKLTTELKKPGLVQELRSIFFKTGVFYLLAEPFIGFNKYLLAGCGVFILPQLLSLVSHKFPKANILDQIVPRGAFRIVFFSFVSIFAVSYLKTLDLSPSDFILTSFVFLPLPVLAFALIDMFSGQRPFDITKNPKFRYLYRALGLIVLGILTIIVLGKDPYLSVKNYIIDFPDHWAAFVDQCSSLWSWITVHAQLTWSWISEHSQLTWSWISEHSQLTWSWISEHSQLTWSWISEHSQLAWAWISEHALTSANWITEQINSGWRVFKNEWLPAINIF